ncbi:hypothetical protein ACVH9Z_22790 [Rhodococcus opacus]|uniref:hypothetical protein n=1 Tax=Rhodococcus opacus TaxID=37919 RepID=UPI001FEEF6BA|nr:hypothetical protein [Rhodococcus opacus]
MIRSTARIRREASDRWLSTGSRGLRGMTGEPVELDDDEAATVLAALVETTGGRWPTRPAGIARMLSRLDVDGDLDRMAAVIMAVTAEAGWALTVPVRGDCTRLVRGWYRW